MITHQYPARLERTAPDEIVVSLRDLPECLTSGVDEPDALAEAQDALEEAVAGRIADGEPLPAPSAPRAGERLIAVAVPAPAGTVAVPLTGI